MFNIVCCEISLHKIGRGTGLEMRGHSALSRSVSALKRENEKLKEWGVDYSRRAFFQQKIC